jgi:CRISPR-associated protein Cmr2
MHDLDGLAERCRALVADLRRSDAQGAAPHAGGKAARPADHALTTAALVGCLAHDLPQCHRLRLAALAHDLPAAERDAQLAGDRQAQEWAALLAEHGAQLDRGAVPELPNDGDARLLTLAHLAAATRLPVRARGAFARHPLAGDLRIDLVYGGATKIKQYVFESARLPEIRGASALLDHINRLDLPALWGLEPLFSTQGEPTPAQLRRYREARDWFAARFGAEPLDAPECVLYASGGNILALAPAGYGARLAQAIERRYTEVTQVAQSVAVAASVSLLELQYGRQSQQFWADDFAAGGQPGALTLIKRSFGTADPQEIFGADSLGAGELTAARKGFGELVTMLASQADQRRAGDGAGTGTKRFPVFLDLPSAARRCASCDVRPAAHVVPPPTNIVLCDACQRKRDAGLAAKKGPIDEQTTPPEQKLDWMYPWGKWLEDKSEELHRTRDIRATVNTLPDIAGAASGQAGGFVGLVYADGNNVGAHIAQLSSIAAYRQFAQQMLEANERAVALALIDHLGPTERSKIWPFEIITIGGDDVLLFAPADRALAVAATIAREFGNEMQRHNTGITLSAGVLLMADHTPVRFARDLAEALLKSAKQRLKQNASLPTPDEHYVDQRTTIDFMALKAASMVSESIASYRSAAYSRTRKRTRDGQPRETRLQLTQRPYTLKEFTTLLGAGQALDRAGFPHSQLHQLAEIVGEGHQLRASIDYHYFVERGRGRANERANPYVVFEQAIGALCGSEDAAPWRTLPERHNRLEFDTPLLDLIEILPFIGPAEREERT